MGKLVGPHRYLFVHRDSDKEEIKTWQKDKVDLKTKVVCSECNSRWMSELETATKAVTKDMIVDCAQTTLNARDLGTLAAFALTKAIVADHMHTHRPPILTFSERQLFARRFQFPRGIQMWLASTESNRGLFKSMYSETPANTARGFYFQTFTYGFGRLVIQVVICRWRKKSLRRHADQPSLRQGIGWSSMSIPFWPHDGTSVQWPPANHLGDNIVDKFVHRWESLNFSR